MTLLHRKLLLWPLAGAVLLAACSLGSGLSRAKPAPVRDAMFFVTGSLNAWSVSRGEAGCFLMSPWRHQTSRLAIGRHPKFGLGIYAVGFPMSVPGDDRTAPVGLRMADGVTAKVGTLVAPDLLFVSLTAGEVSSDLVELGRSGVHWLLVRDTWVAHSGQAVGEAVDAYRKDCSGWAPQPVTLSDEHPQ